MPRSTPLRQRPLIEAIPVSSPESLRRAYAAYRRMDPVVRTELDSVLTVVIERIKCKAETSGRMPPPFSPCQALELLAAMMEKGYL